MCLAEIKNLHLVLQEMQDLQVAMSSAVCPRVTRPCGFVDWINAVSAETEAAWRLTDFRESMRLQKVLEPSGSVPF